jgi:putative DNA primase/helicase
MRTALAEDPFAPLDNEDRHLGPAPGSEQPRPMLPVPAYASAPILRHFRHGTASQSWGYKNPEGQLLGYMVRFEMPEGKVILPLTWCRLSDGGEDWRWKSFSRPRPLFGIDRLAARPKAPVLIVEGEKTTDAAQERFVEHVVVTWPGGSNAVGTADWTPLAGRCVTIWPDADQPGQKAADEIAKLVLRAGAASVAIVQISDTLPVGWDLADPLPDDFDPEQMLVSARRIRLDQGLPPGYALTARGLVWRDPADPEKPEILLAGPFEIMAETRDAEGNSWGVLLKWMDHDGREHRHALPRASLAGDGADARRILLDGGLFLAPSRKAREQIGRAHV